MVEFYLRKKMSKLKNKKNKANIQKGAEFVEGAIDGLGNAGWNLFKFWLKMMMWFVIIGVSFVFLESTVMKGNTDTLILILILLSGAGGFYYVFKKIANNKKKGYYTENKK